MSDTFLTIILDTSIFLERRYPTFDLLHKLIQNGIVQIKGVEVHVPYAVKSELRLQAVNLRSLHMQAQAMDARRWISDNQDGLEKETWLENETAASLFPNRSRDQILHYAAKQLDRISHYKYMECWLITQDTLLQLSARGNGLQAYDMVALDKQLDRLFPVNYLNTRWMIAAMENRMEREMAIERRKSAKYILVVDVGVLLRTETFAEFLRVLAKDRRPDFLAGIQIDVAKIVMDKLVDVQRDIACRFRNPEAVVSRAMKLMGKYSSAGVMTGKKERRDSHLVLHLEEMEHFLESKTNLQVYGTIDYEEGILRYCRHLVEEKGHTHVVALLTDDSRKRMLMRTEKFQVITLWPAN